MTEGPGGAPRAGACSYNSFKSARSTCLARAGASLLASRMHCEARPRECPPDGRAKARVPMRQGSLWSSQRRRRASDRTVPAGDCSSICRRPKALLQAVPRRAPGMLDYSHGQSQATEQKPCWHVDGAKGILILWSTHESHHPLGRVGALHRLSFHCLGRCDRFDHEPAPPSSPLARQSRRGCHQLRR
jgi:hypothetical protein